MRNFQKLAAGLQVMPLMHAIQRQPELWDADTARTAFTGSAMVQVNDILLHFGASRADMKCRFHPAYFKLPQVRPLLNMLRQMVDGYQMERVIISKLEPGAVVLAHTDTDGYAGEAGLNRYHMILQGMGGNLYRCGEETVDMATGDLWWFNAQVEHECVNRNPTEARVHLMADFRIMP